MAITRWDPWHDVLSLQNRMNSLFQELSRNQGENDVSATTAGFVPPADIYEDEHQIILKLEIPGIRQEDLDIQVENDTLMFAGNARSRKKRRKKTSAASSAAMGASTAPSPCRIQSTPIRSRRSMRMAC